MASSSVRRVLLLVLLALSSVAPARGACRIGLIPGAIGAQEGGGASKFISPREYFSEYEAYFREHGCEVIRFELPVDGTIEERGMVLRDQIRRAPGEKLDLLAHSQGGLDARFALAFLKTENVRSLATIGTPHQGTPVADWVVEQTTKQGFWFRFLRTFGGYDFSVVRFVPEMRASFLREHAQVFAPRPDVRYASARAVCESDCHWQLRLSAWIVGLGPGDGLVPGTSQALGDDLGTYNLDHLSTVAADPAKREERRRFLDAYWQWRGAIR